MTKIYKSITEKLYLFIIMTKTATKSNVAARSKLLNYPACAFYVYHNGLDLLSIYDLLILDTLSK